MSMQCKEKKNPKHENKVSFHYNAPVMVDIISMVLKNQHDMGTISFKCSILILIFLLINSLWLVSTNLNENLIEKGIDVLNNVSAVLIVVMLSHMYRFQEEYTGDTWQVR